MTHHSARSSRLVRVGLLAVAIIVSVSTPSASERAGQVRVNLDAQLSMEFTKLVEQYVQVHRKADQAVPEVSNSATAEEVSAHVQAVARLIAQARGRSKQGDIFTRDIRAYFRRQIGRAVSGPDGAQIKASIMEDNPGAIKLQVNGPYPDTIPVAFMPPQILEVLPKLPRELEYRFIGVRLILHDIHANLIADYIDDALPD